MSANVFTVSNWSGQATLNGAGGGDSYTVHLVGSGSGKVTINDTGGSVDSLVVNGTGAADAFIVTGAQVQRGSETVQYAGLETLTVNGLATADSFNVTGVSTSTTLNGAGGSDTFHVRAINAGTTINTGVGTDTVNVGSASPGSGNVNAIAAKLTVVGSTTDTLNVDDHDGGAHAAFVAAARIWGLGMPSSTSTAGGVTYSGIRNLNLRLGSRRDTVNVHSTVNGTTTTIETGGGTEPNTVNVGSAAPGSGNVNAISGLLVLVGQSTSDTVNVDDHDSGPETVVLTANRIWGLDMPGSAATVRGITYSGIETLNFGLGTRQDTVHIESTNAGTTTTLNTGGGVDTVHVRTISGPTVLNTEAGADTINVGTTSNNVNQISALLTIAGGTPTAGSDVLNVFDSGDGATNTGFLTDTTITGLDMALGIVYGGIEDVNIYLGSGADTFTILNTHGGRTLVDTGSNDDTVNVRRISGVTTIQGAGDTDTINVGSLAAATGGTVNAIDAHLIVRGNAGNDVLNIDDTGDGNVNDGVLTSSTLNGLDLSPSGITYTGLVALNIHLGSGSDTFRIDTTHEGSTVVDAGPGGDRIDVRTIAGATTINGEAGGDTINVGSLAPTMIGGIVDGINAVLTINGGGDAGVDQINIDDSGDGNGNIGTLTSTRISGLDMGGPGVTGHIDYFTVEVLNIDLGIGSDTFTIESTHVGTTTLDSSSGSDEINVQTISGSTFLNTRLGDDTINVGNTGDLADQISALLTIDGGAPPAGSDILNLFDSGDTADNIGFLTDTAAGTEITGLGMALGIIYGDIEELNIFLGSGNDIFNISGTDSATWVYAGAGNDAVNVHRINDETLVFGQTGDDRIHVGILFDAASGFLLDARNGSLIDPRVTGTGDGETSPNVVARNTPNLIGARLTLDGRDGGDQYFIWLSGTGGGGLINVFDSGSVGGDFLTVFASEQGDVILLRAGVGDKDLTDLVVRGVPEPVTAQRAGLVAGDLAAFGTARIGMVALLNAGRTSTPADVERVNYSRNIEQNTGINGNLIVQGVGGRDEFYVDDNLAPTQLFGGSAGNYFQFGQLYNSPRADNFFAGIADPADEFLTVETTRGFISNGTSFDLTAVGALDGENQFVIINNQATLNLLGGDRGDIFTVRSFAHVGSVDASRRGVDISTGGGENLIEYVVGAPINIDGGGGFNTLKIIGTEFGDDYVITADGVFGGGRLVNFVNIQQLEVDAAEGNDRFFIQGTAPGTSVILSGSLGSDVFFVGGQAPDIISRDLLGHSGIIAHGVASNDPNFDGLRTDEIAANVGDNDEAGIVITEEGGETVVVQGVRFDSYTVVLTRRPTSAVTVTASAPRAVVRVEERTELRPIAQLAKSPGGSFNDTVELVFGSGNWDVPQAVWVQVASGQPFTGVVTGFVSHDVAGDRVVGTTTAALRFAGQDPNRLVDSSANFGPIDSLRGATVTITEGSGKGLSRNIVANTATTLTFDKPWVLAEVPAGQAGDSANQSDYEIRLFEGLAIPVVSVKTYFTGPGAALLTPGGGLEVIEQSGGVNFAAPTSFVGSYQVVLTEAPTAGNVVVTIDAGDGLQTDQASLTFTTTNWFQPQTVRVAIGADGVVQKTRLLEISHTIGGNAIESAFVRVIDGDSPTVVLTESDGSTNVIEDELFRSGVPRADDYTVVLSQRPTSNVEVVVRAEGTRTSKGRVVNFGEQVRLGANGSNFSNTVTLVFTPNNWNQAQTVQVKALDDDVVDGGDTKVFPRLADDTSRIQGPLLIQGGGQGSLVGLPIPVLLPGETNEFIPSGDIEQAEGPNSNSVVVDADDLALFIVKYGLNFGLEPGASPFDALIGKTFRFIDGLNGTEFDRRFGPLSTTGEIFNPADPELQRLVPFREIAGVTDLGSGLVELTFDLDWNFDVHVGETYALINASPANFFAVEDDQVDLFFVLDSDARSDEVGRLIFHTQNDPANLDVPVQNRGQLVGLGMHNGRTLGTGVGATRLPAGIMFDEIEALEITLGSGDDRFVIEGTHSGSTRVNGGVGDDHVEIWSAAGPTTVNGGTGDDVITVGEPEASERTLSRIAALVTIGGDVPAATVRTTVRGEPDVLGPGGGLIAQGSTNEQEIIINAGGGTFTLRFKGAVTDPDAQPPAGLETAPIAHDATAAAITQALLDLNVFLATDFEVERFGDRIIVRFTGTGTFAKTPMHLLGTGSGNLLQTGTNTLNVVGTADALDAWAVLTGSTLTGLGMPATNAIQTIFVDDPLPGDALRPFTLSFNGHSTGSLDVTTSAADVQAALEALPSIGSGNVAVNKIDNVFVVRFQGTLTNRLLPVLTAGAGDAHVFIAIREPGIDKLDPADFAPSADSSARNDLQVLTIDATGGTFRLEFGVQFTGELAHNASADEVRDALQRLVGNQFADDIAVGRFGTAYQILFQGVLRQVMGGNGVGFLKVDTGALAGTATLVTRMDGVNYYFIDELNIDFGSGDDVLNVQSTTAGVTNIALNDGDDRIFVSSDADLDPNTVGPQGAVYAFDFLTGHLDGILGDLNIDAGQGRHVMMISDEATGLSKGTSDVPVTIQRVDNTFTQPAILGDIEIEILNLNLVGRAIRFGAASNGNFFDGITLWGGQNGNVFDVNATHLRVSQQWRTQTTLNTGDGGDTVTVDLVDGSDDFFVLNGQGGDDDIDARTSTLPLVIFGGTGGDEIFGGQGGDLIFGDHGRIVYRDENGGGSTILGHGGTYDFTDGRKLPPYVMFTVDPFTGGKDDITGGQAPDAIVGGALGDTIDAGEGNNTVLGDAAWIEIDFGLSEVGSATEHAGAVPLRIESVLDTFDLQRAWNFDIDPFTATDLVITGGVDTIDAGSDNDVVAGGLDDDTIRIVGGHNTVLGDNGIVTFQEGTRILASVVSTYLRTTAETFVQGGDDTIETGTGNDVVIGSLGDDKITVADGNNVIFGDEGFVKYQDQADTNTTSVLGEVASSYIDGAGRFVQGGVDEIETGGGNDTIIAGLGNDDIGASDGDNIVLADDGTITYQTTSGLLNQIESRYQDGLLGDGDSPAFGDGAEVGNDKVRTGNDDDIVIGSLGVDRITIDGGENVVLADEGRLLFEPGTGQSPRSKRWRHRKAAPTS